MTDVLRGTAGDAAAAELRPGSESPGSRHSDEEPVVSEDVNAPAALHHAGVSSVDPTVVQAAPDASESSETLLTASASVHREEEVDADPHVAALDALSLLVEQANAAVAAVPAGAAKPSVVVRLAISMLEQPMSKAAQQLSGMAVKASRLWRVPVTSSTYKLSLA